MAHVSQRRSRGCSSVSITPGEAATWQGTTRGWCDQDEPVTPRKHLDDGQEAVERQGTASRGFMFRHRWVMHISRGPESSTEKAPLRSPWRPSALPVTWWRWAPSPGLGTRVALGLPVSKQQQWHCAAPRGQSSSPPFAAAIKVPI